MQMQTQTQQLFHFWRENQLTGHFTLTTLFLVANFKQWLKQVKNSPARGVDWYNYYYGERAIRCFITDKEYNGLNSTFEESDIESIYNTLKPYFNEKHS